MSTLPGFHAADRTFFPRDVLDVAPELLCYVLQRMDDDGTSAGRAQLRVLRLVRR
ncbi:hypothetical protein AB4Y72_18960 [Arthrobacter sp. YAF34]|uniref:hypothetical protein n=1 Tax=Arthrobacter sp. YAF34 TaxID=3233083 RepID=UPI003F90D654